MKTTLRSVFDRMRKNLVGEPSKTLIRGDQFDIIKDMMKERGSDLELAYLHSWRPFYLKDIGIVVDEKTSVYAIMHAEGNPQDVFEEVTRRALDKNDIKHYRPEDVMRNADYHPWAF